MISTVLIGVFLNRGNHDTKMPATSEQTSDNKRLSEMAVGVETRGLLLPMTLCDSSGHGAHSPPLRQAAGRYLPFALLRCEFIDNSLREAKTRKIQIIIIIGIKW